VRRFTVFEDVKKSKRYQTFSNFMKTGFGTDSSLKAEALALTIR
jgi:hypothetical protein